MKLTNNCKCKNCGKEFHLKLYAIKQGEGKYCSKVCKKSVKGQVNKVCQICSKEYKVWPAYSSSKFCSKKCAYISFSGKELKITTLKRILGKFKYGWKDTRGYIHIYTENGYKLQHRLIMEQKIGRSLTKDEVIHHINGIKNDNRIENLMLTNPTEHVLIETAKGTYKGTHKNQLRSEKGVFACQL